MSFCWDSYTITVTKSPGSKVAHKDIFPFRLFSMSGNTANRDLKPLLKQYTLGTRAKK